jgi:hypothetical protein
MPVAIINNNQKDNGSWGTTGIEGSWNSEQSRATRTEDSWNSEQSRATRTEGSWNSEQSRATGIGDSWNSEQSRATGIGDSWNDNTTRTEGSWNDNTTGIGESWKVIASRNSSRFSPGSSPPNLSSTNINKGNYRPPSHQANSSNLDSEETRSFKRRFSIEEREFHKVALNKARKQAMAELQLPREWIEDKLDDLTYKIDPRTQTPANSFFESFQRLRKFGLELRNPDQRVIVDNLSDTMIIDGHEFSRDHFYRNNYFQTALVDYYWNLLKTGRTYHPVKVIYHQKKPHLKIGFKDTRVNGADSNDVVGIEVPNDPGVLVQMVNDNVVELGP